ncbi:MAG: hypothetical protein K0Q53_1433 [Massilibacillus sp.]|jgi:putative membrane protein|nr:hypothetical protein [Massilibacillus sp.]
MSVLGGNLVNFLMYLLVAIPLMMLGIFIFIHTTSYNEFAIMKKGGDVSDFCHVDAAMAASYDLGGKIIGLAIVIASAIFHSVTIFDLAIWGIIGIIFEVFVFCLFRLLAPIKVTEEIPKGNVAVGIFSAALSLSSSLIMSALIS